MQKHLALLVLAVFGSAIVLSTFAASYTSAYAQGNPYSEEYMEQHDGGDRNEYLQEIEHSDPEFYVPAVSEANSTSSSATVE
jgi:hypothetical protein